MALGFLLCEAQEIHCVLWATGCQLDVGVGVHTWQSGLVSCPSTGTWGDKKNFNMVIQTAMRPLLSAWQCCPGMPGSCLICSWQNLMPRMATGGVLNVTVDQLQPMCPGADGGSPKTQKWFRVAWARNCFYFFFFFSTGVWTQGLVLARQVLYNWATLPTQALLFWVWLILKILGY
jgi:hypothetical protein